MREASPFLEVKHPGGARLGRLLSPPRAAHGDSWWVPPLLWLSHRIRRGCRPCEMVHRRSCRAREGNAVLFTAAQTAEKMYFFSLMARNAPTELDVKRGRE